MKVFAVLFAFLAVANAFAPSSVNARTSTQLNALFDNIFGMDLWDRDNNKYGKRDTKIKTGSIGANSYVPDGLSKDQYAKVRAAEEAKKKANYQRNVAKAGKFQDFTSFYLKRGTAENGSWLKAAGRGHDFVKTKYDWTGKKSDVKGFYD